MRLVAMLIADDARDPDGTPATSWPWSALPIEGRVDPRTGEWRDGLTERTGASARAISDALTGLARAGYEMRVAIGEDKHGRPVFAAKGHAMRFQVPPLLPRPVPQSAHSGATFERQSPHRAATFGSQSPHSDATYAGSPNGQRSHPAAQRSHQSAPKVAPECDPISSDPPTIPSHSEASAVDLTKVEVRDDLSGQDRDIAPDQAADRNGRPKIGITDAQATADRRVLAALPPERMEQLLTAAVAQLPGATNREQLHAAAHLATSTAGVR